jgi:hypothetical protein
VSVVIKWDNKKEIEGGGILLRKFYVILMLILLTSCNQADEQLLGKELSLHSSNLMKKSGALLILTEQEQLQTIGANMYSFVTVNEWFSNDTLLYLTDESGVSFIYKFHILTGEEEIFFQINEPILRLDANPNNSIFVIEIATMDGENELYFVGANGKLLYTLKNLGVDYQIYWNPFKENELTIAVLEEDFSFKLKNLNLNSKKLTEFDFEHYYVQWIGEDELAYLNWDVFSLSYYAPLIAYDIAKDKEITIANDVIAFFSYHDYFLTISIDDPSALNSDYTFYHSGTKSKLSKLQVPILNTYSGQWWIPNHAFHQMSNTFYFINPNNNGNLYHYSDGFTLVSFQIETEKTREIVPLDLNYPIKISPDGRWLLYGYQLENIIDIKTKEIHSLLYW